MLNQQRSPEGLHATGGHLASEYSQRSQAAGMREADAGAFGMALGGSLVNNAETAQQVTDLFQRRLDQLLVGFRSETMQEFLATKKRLGIEQA